MKHVLLTIIAFSVTAFASAQSLKELFLHMPQELCPLLSEYNRLELVDNQKTGRPMETTNVLRSTSEMAALTDNYARLKTTKNTEKVFKLLKTNDGETVIAIVSTVFIDDIPDSHIEFFTKDWQAVDAGSMISFDQNDGFHYMELKPGSDEMRLVTGSPLKIALDGSNRIEKPKASSKTLKWTGEKFE